MRERYAAGVRHADEAIGALRAALEARGRWDEALVWITADHGEALGENGFAGHGVSWLGPALIQRAAAAEAAALVGARTRPRSRRPSRLFDILPTTLALLRRPPTRRMRSGPI